MSAQGYVSGGYTCRDRTHTTAGMMMKYVKFDDESKREKMNLLNNGQSHGVETVFDHAITDEERIRLGIPTRDAGVADGSVIITESEIETDKTFEI
ncbi:MAG: hypothetical protein K2L17_01410 [Muribaculaceae bacterium]|nr:hypothetical protein [Muribaculaceae bacterium]